MAKTTLPTNYVDDVLNGAMDGKRRYREIPNADGTISLEDATTYDQIGNNFGASQVNLMNDNINQSFDANKMLKTMDEVNAVEQEGYGVDALVVKQLNNSLGDISGFTNSTYDSIADFLQYCVDNGYLPDINIVSLIPIMTSNTKPSGVASASSVYSDSYAYKAFNGVINNSVSNCWCGEKAETAQWLMYKFDTAKTVKKIEMCAVANGSYVRCKNFIFQGSNDGSSFVDLLTDIYPNDSSLTKHVYTLSNNKAYKYYRVYIKDAYSGSIASCGLSYLQMYGN